MVEHKCPYCGAASTIPTLFRPSPQAIFRYIWENPGCTGREVIAHGHRMTLGTFHTQICAIRKELKKTDYELIGMPGNQRPQRYRIVLRRKGPSNAATDFTPVIR